MLRRYDAYLAAIATLKSRDSRCPHCREPLKLYHSTAGVVLHCDACDQTIVTADAPLRAPTITPTILQ